MAGKPGSLSEKPTELPARYTQGFAWNLDRRCQNAREVASDLWRLWIDLGGVESLSVQQLWLAERVVFLRRRALEFETATMAGKTPPFDAGTHSNVCNVIVGHLRALGLERKARNARTLRDVMNGTPA